MICGVHTLKSEFSAMSAARSPGHPSERINVELARPRYAYHRQVADPPLIQTKLLRVLQDQRFMRLGGTREILSRFRLVAATNRDLWKEVREGRFREDLLYRIFKSSLTIPPLRERKQDIPGLVQAFIEHFARRHDKHPLPLSPEQQRRVCEYDWPGNVRELKNEIEQAVILNNAGQLDFVLGTSPAAHQPADRPHFSEPLRTSGRSGLRALSAPHHGAHRRPCAVPRCGNPAQDEALHHQPPSSKYGILRLGVGMPDNRTDVPPSPCPECEPCP